MIVCRSAAELEKMRAAGRLVGEVLTELAATVAPGVTTADLDAVAEERIRDAGATPAFKGYHGYPGDDLRVDQRRGDPRDSVGRRVLQEGDIISIDVGASLDGYFGDSAITVPVGPRLGGGGDAAAGDRGVALQGDRRGAGPAARVSDIGHAVQQHVEAHGFSVVREFVGPRHRAADARGAADPELRRAGPRAAAGRGHGAGDRADGERGQAGGEGAGGRLDGGDARRQPVGALRAHGGGDGGRAVDSDGADVPVAAGATSTRLARGRRWQTEAMASCRAAAERAVSREARRRGGR